MSNFERLRAETGESSQYVFGASIVADVMLGRFDLGTYIRFLTNAYHHVRHTVPLMMACGARLPASARWLLDPLRAYIDEEIGHEAWIVNDLETCGVPAQVTLASQPHPAVEMLVAYVYDYINRVAPIGFLGMVHVLEGSSTTLATETARRVQAQLGLPDQAFSYLRSHGALDLEHVSFFQGLVDRLPADDLHHVIHVATRVYRLYGAVLGAASDTQSRAHHAA